jgi:hypothetical protein
MMQKRYMIVRITNVLAQMKHDDSMITEDCYTIVDKDYDEPQHAYNIKQRYREPNHYIVVKYWK